jgi:hypothetical protein
MSNQPPHRNALTAWPTFPISIGQKWVKKTNVICSCPPLSSHTHVDAQALVLTEVIVEERQYHPPGQATWQTLHDHGCDVIRREYFLM